MVVVVVASVPSGKRTSSLKRPPSHRVLSLPGMQHSHFFRSSVPWAVFAGFATNPKGWSFLHCFLREADQRGSKAETETWTETEAETETETWTETDRNRKGDGRECNQAYLSSERRF